MSLKLLQKIQILLFHFLVDKYLFKLKGSSVMTFHLGCDFYRDDTNTLCMSTYLDKLFSNYKRMFGCKPKPYSCPLDCGDHPELDTSPELDMSGIETYQSIIGSL